MSTPNFTGPYQKVLTELAQTLDDLWAEHGTSFVKAGDDLVYALGAEGYIVVMDERKWGGLVELLTPKTTLAIRPNETGGPTITAADLDEAAIKKAIEECNEAIKAYYAKRYWSTPKIA